MVVSKEPQLLERESQLLFCIADKKATLVQVQFTCAPACTCEQSKWRCVNQVGLEV
jgi:hypothetical protein